MNLCIVTNSFPRHPGDSAGKFVLESNAAVVAGGHRVHVIVPHQPGVGSKALMEGMTVHRYRYAPDLLETEYGRWYAHEWVKSPKMRSVYLARLAFLPFLIAAGCIHTFLYCRVNRTDWVIGHWVFPSGLVAYAGGRLARKKVALRAYGGDVVVLSKVPLMRQLVRFLLHHADVILPISHTTGDEVLARGTPRDRVRVVYKGYDPERYHAGIDGSGVRKRHGLSGDDFVVLSIGRLVPYKGLSFFIDAASQVAAKCPQAKFLIGGRGPLHAELQSQITASGLDHCIKLIGFVPEEDLPHLYAACDIYVSSSIIDSAGNREGFGMTVLEAMACRRPVIVTNAGAPQEFVDHLKTGVVAGAGDACALADAICLLIDDKELRQALAATAAHKITDLTWHQLAGQLTGELSRFSQVKA